MLPQSAVLSDEQGQLRLHHQRQERGRAARHQDRHRQRQRRDDRRRPVRQRGGRAVGRPVPQSRPEGESASVRRRAEAPRKVVERMNFRNISSWCIRNPVFPIVLFVGLMLAGLDRVRADAGEQRAGHRFPGGDRLRLAARRRAERDGDAGHPARRIRDPRGQWRRRDQQHGQRGQQHDLRARSRSARRPTARSTTSATRSPRSAATCPRGSSSRRSRASTPSDEPISYVGAQTTDMTLEQLSWYIDNTVAKRLLGVDGVAAVSARVGGVDRTIRVILDPAALQAQGITAAQVNQQLRQSNMNGAGGRAEIAGSEQSVRVLGNARDAYELSQTQIALPGGRFVRLADLGEVKDSNSRAALDRQDERPPGRHLHGPARQGLVGGHRLRRRLEGARQAREGKPEGPLLRDLHHRRLYQGAIQVGDGRPDRRRDPRRPRRAPVPPRHPRDRSSRRSPSRCRRSPPSGS